VSISGLKISTKANEFAKIQVNPTQSNRFYQALTLLGAVNSLISALNRF
jgi:hypothetical protein